MEIETIPAGAQEPGGSVDLNQDARRDEEMSQEGAADEVPVDLAGFYAGLAELQSARDCIMHWTGRHHFALLAATGHDRAAAEKALLKCLRQVGGAGVASLTAASGYFKREVDKALATPPADKQTDADSSVPPALAPFYARIGEIELPGEAVAVWMKYRADLAPLPVADREAAWRSLCKRTEEVGRMKNAKVWLKKAIAEEDSRRGITNRADSTAA